jgi:DNA repair/transcription protein MET18/MMS19
LEKVPDVVRYENMHGQKKGILRDLGKALDDPSRSVRKEAVVCRARW